MATQAKQIMRTLSSLHSRWKHSRETESATLGSDSMALTNYIKSNIEFICDELLSVDRLTQQVSAYEALIKDLTGAKTGKTQTGVAAEGDDGVLTGVIPEPTDVADIVSVDEGPSEAPGTVHTAISGGTKPTKRRGGK